MRSWWAWGGVGGEGEGVMDGLGQVNTPSQRPASVVTLPGRPHHPSLTSPDQRAVATELRLAASLSANDRSKD